MKKNFSETIEIPSGIECEIKHNELICKKGSVVLIRHINIPNLSFKVDSKNITISSLKGNKRDYKKIKSFMAHLKNNFSGLGEKYIYHLEACNVHFPMTMKVETNKLIINNFLGEKKPRHAVILHGVEVDVKGQKITVSSHSKEAAGQTAANIEKATKIRNRDRRIFQDGIYITEKPGVKHA